jgi:hypothetical protein
VIILYIYIYIYIYISPKMMDLLPHHLDKATNLPTKPTHRSPDQHPHRANLPAQHTHKWVKPCRAVCAHQTLPPSVSTKAVLSPPSTLPPPKAPPPHRDRLPGACQLTHPNLTHTPPSRLCSTRLRAKQQRTSRSATRFLLLHSPNQEHAAPPSMENRTTHWR